MSLVWRATISAYQSGRIEPSRQCRAVRRSEFFRLHFKGMQHYCESYEDVVALLRQHRINPTRQRIQIARTLFSRRGHLSADGVLALVNEERPATSKATVYNTLNLFVERGLVREVIAHPNKVFYDANTSPHYHFYDTGTGELTDIPIDDLAITQLPQLPAGTVTEGIDIIVRVRTKLTT